MCNSLGLERASVGKTTDLFIGLVDDSGATAKTAVKRILGGGELVSTWRAEIFLNITKGRCFSFSCGADDKFGTRYNSCCNGGGRECGYGNARFAIVKPFGGGGETITLCKRMRVCVCVCESVHDLQPR